MSAKRPPPRWGTVLSMGYKNERERKPLTNPALCANFARDPQSLDVPLHRMTRYPQQRRRVLAHPAAPTKRFLHQRTFHVPGNLIQRLALRKRHLQNPFPTLHFRSYRQPFYPFALGDDQGPLQHVSEFPDVTGPMVFRQLRDDMLGYLRHLVEPEISHQLDKDLLHQDRQIVDAFHAVKVPVAT